MNPPAYRRELTPFWRFMDWLCESIERITHRRTYTTERASEYDVPTSAPVVVLRFEVVPPTRSGIKPTSSGWTAERASEYEEER